MTEITFFPYPSNPDAWICKGPAPELYPTMNEIPDQIPAVYFRAAEIFCSNTVGAVAALEGYLGPVLIYEAGKPIRYRFHLHGKAAESVATIPMRILRAAIADGPIDITRPRRIATVAWMLFSWFELELHETSV